MVYLQLGGREKRCIQVLAFCEERARLPRAVRLQGRYKAAPNRQRIC